MMQTKQNKENTLQPECVCKVFVFAATRVCEGSDGARVLSTCTCSYMCMIESMECVCVCVCVYVCVRLCLCSCQWLPQALMRRLRTATHTRHCSRSPDLLLTFPPYTPPPTLIHTHTILNPCFSLLAGQLSVPVLSLCHLPLSCIHHFISLPPSLSGSDPEAAC